MIYKNVNVIGLGYIGLPTALMLASKNQKIVGTDYKKELVNSLKNGNLTFKEHGLIELFNEAVLKGISFTTEYQKTNIYIIAVPTPYLKETKKLDPKYVIAAVNNVLDVCLENTIIIIESTISPGTIEKSIKPIIEDRGLIIGKDINIVHAPERIIPGRMLFELENNSRTIGADSYDVGVIVKDLYSSFCRGEIVITDIKTAEMSKVVENTYRDINIAFANELAQICRFDNMDVYEIIKTANKHPRVNILNPGPGVGGHCISVDPWFLVGDYPDLTNLILTARKINDNMPSFVLKRVKTIMDHNNITDISKVGLYGLTYKEDVDDVRESPTLQFLEILANHLSFGIKVFDPFVKNKIVPGQILNFEEFLSKIDLIVIMVGHKHIIDNMDSIKNKLILDTKNICFFENCYKL